MRDLEPRTHFHSYSDDFFTLCKVPNPLFFLAIDDDLILIDRMSIIIIYYALIYYVHLISRILLESDKTIEQYVSVAGMQLYLNMHTTNDSFIEMARLEIY